VVLLIETLTIRTTSEWASVYSNELFVLLSLIVLYIASRKINSSIPGGLPQVGNLKEKFLGIEKWIVASLVIVGVTLLWMSSTTNAIIPLIAAPQALNTVGTDALSGYLLVTGGTGILEELTHVALFYTVLQAFLISSFLFLGLSSMVLYLAFPQLGLLWFGLTGLSLLFTKIRLGDNIKKIGAIGMAMVYSAVYFAGLHPAAGDAAFWNHALFRGLMNAIATQFGVLTTIGIHAANNGVQLTSQFGLPPTFVWVPVGLFVVMLYLAANYQGRGVGK